MAGLDPATQAPAANDMSDFAIHPMAEIFGEADRDE
jgi:hypothetical protein